MVDWPPSDPLQAGCIATVQLLGLVLLVVRTRPAQRHGQSGAAASLFSSMLIGGLLFRQTSGAESGLVADVALVAATAWTVAALTTLGRSFGLVAARRPLVTRGPYRLVRHPVYLGECVMGITCLARGTIQWWTIGLVAVLAVALSWRMRVEERTLCADPAWRDYCSKVRYRLVPGIW